VILYTMMPQELIFPTDELEFSKQMMIEYDGIPLLVEDNMDQTYQVIRILSSDPKHYLDSRYTPGSKISIFT
jgi:hypothetical protein